MADQGEGVASADHGPRRVEQVPPDLVRSNLAMWGLMSLVLVGLAAAALLIVRGVERGPRPPFLMQPALSPAGEEFRRDPSVLHVAGSGGNLPLTRALADAFSAADSSARVVVHGSIGSTGGVRAAYDGAVDLGLVSRGFKDAERRLGLRLVPYARVAVVFAVDPRVGITDLTRQQMLALYRGEVPSWENETPVVVLQREEGDSSHLVAREALPGFAEVDQRALDEDRWRVLYSDRAMHEALASTSGAIGLIDIGAAVSDELAVRVLSLDGVYPSAAAVSNGSYPLSKPLSFVTSTSPSERATAFMNFVFSPAGQEIIRANGYLPIPERADE